MSPQALESSPLDHQATRMDLTHENLRRNSLASIPEQKVVESRLPTLPYGYCDESPRLTTFTPAHRSLRSLSPSRLPFPSRAMQHDTELPVFMPTAVSASPATVRTAADYYDDRFKDKSVSSIARDRVLQMTPVIANLRTNVVINDEFTVITDLSNQLSTRYSRPESSILITLDHSASVCLGGSFDPAYFLTISACSKFLQPTLNKRNAALIQKFLFDVMGLPPSRGIVRFVTIPEESLAMDGRTVLGDIQAEEKNRGAGSDAASIASSTRPSFFRGLNRTRNRSRHTIGAQSQKSINDLRSPSIIHNPRSSAEMSNASDTPAVPPLPASSMSTLAVPAGKPNSYADSGIGTPTDGKPPASPSSGANPSGTPPLASAVPSDVAMHPSSTKLGKRKSFFSMIRRTASRPVIAA